MAERTPTLDNFYDDCAQLQELSAEMSDPIRDEVREIVPRLKAYAKAYADGKAQLQELLTEGTRRQKWLEEGHTEILAAIGQPDATAEAPLPAPADVVAAGQQLGSTSLMVIPQIVPLAGGKTLTWNHVLIGFMTMAALSFAGVDVVALVEHYTGVDIPTVDEADAAPPAELAEPAEPTPTPGDPDAPEEPPDE